MSLSMYTASVPVFVRALRNLSHVLGKAASHVGADADALLELRIAPDMFPLVKQVQIATDMAKNAVARLAGVDAMPVADDETTIAQLRARIDRVVEYIQGFDAARLDGSDAREVAVPSRAGTMHFTGRDYLTGFVLPNLYFHSSIAYALLRQAGVPLGKLDFLRGGDA